MLLSVASAHINITRLVQDQFADYDPSYPQWSAEGLAALNATRSHLDVLQQKGYPKFCSEQLYAEATSAVHYYANRTIFSRSHELLNQSLQSPDADSQAWALLENPSGTWGSCYTVQPMVAFNQLDPFINGWNDMASSGTPPQYTPVHALDPWLGDGLVDYCRRHLVSNITDDGVNTREMLAAVSGSLSQLAFKQALRALWNASSGASPLGDAWVEQWWAFLTKEWQDPETGTWGARYVTGEKDAVTGADITVQGHDVSMTFHSLSYAHKDHRRPPRLYPQLFDWLLSAELESGIYPYGRLYHGRPCAHNDYDVRRSTRARTLPQTDTRPRPCSDPPAPHPPAPALGHPPAARAHLAAGAPRSPRPSRPQACRGLAGERNSRHHRHTARPLELRLRAPHGLAVAGAVLRRGLSEQGGIL
jgi:hypothetical protein